MCDNLEFKNLLIIDDSVPMINSIKQLINKFNEENVIKLKIAGEALNGQEGIDLYNKIKPDIIILDIKMPVLDGFAVLKRLKDIKADVKVLVLTNDKTEETKETVKQFGAEYLNKAFTLNEFTKIVNNFIYEKAKKSKEIIKKNVVEEKFKKNIIIQDLVSKPNFQHTITPPRHSYNKSINKFDEDSSYFPFTVVKEDGSPKKTGLFALLKEIFSDD